MKCFCLLARITTTAAPIRYTAVDKNAFNEVPLFRNPPCDYPNNILCFWNAESGSHIIDISITNCGDFYVYLLQPTLADVSQKFRPAAPRNNPFSSRPVTPPLEPVYCTTRENISRGNDYRVIFLTSLECISEDEDLFLLC